MAKIIEVHRKSKVLKHPSLPCLSPYHTLNLMSGCPYECRYCYAQSFRSHPGQGKVLFYINTLDLLRIELPRMRKRPKLVYFSTACEPFVPYRPVLDSLYGVMELLLDHSVFLLISTKSSIPEKFLKLFSEHTDKVHVQVGLTTINDCIRQLLEPNAANVEERLENLSVLLEHGIQTEVRMDPLIPELTDSEQSFVDLCRQISHGGIQQAAASYLFLRRGNSNRMAVEFDNWSFREMARRLYTQKIEKYCGGGTIRIVAADYRRKKYDQLRTISASHGITLHLCSCKNPDVTVECCHSSALIGREQDAQLAFF